MKRFVYSLFSLALAANMAFAGGIVTNTNMSASFVRMPAQDATLGIQAAYHNPAGLTQLSDGFHIQVNNQTIGQTKYVDSEFALLNEQHYEGTVFAPAFPTVYAAYKTGKIAISAAVMPIGGGGSATYSKGLPSFEMDIAAIPILLTKFTGSTIDKYSADISFEGSSVYWGIQGGLSYAITDNISLYAGMRYITAKNTYNGHLKDIMVNAGPSGAMLRADAVFTTLTPTLQAYAQAAAGAATSLGSIITGGGGALTFAQAEGMGIIDQAQRAQLEGGLLQFGVTQAQIDAMAISDAQASYLGYAAIFGKDYVTMTGDQYVAAEQKGTSIIPIVGVNLSLMDKKLNIGAKYEFKSTMEMENFTTQDITGAPQFVNGLKVPANMPAMLSLGADYKATDKLSVAAGFHYYWDRDVSYGRRINDVFVSNDEVMDGDSYEFALGLEYALNDKFTLSGGYLGTRSNPTNAYQNDQSRTMATNTAALGGKVQINKAFAVEAGFMLTFYKDYTDNEVATPLGSLTSETYAQDTYTFAIGLSYSFGKSAE